MVNARRLSGVALVLGATLAACLGSLNLSSTSQYTIAINPSGYDFMTVPVGSGSSTMFTISPKTGSDDDLVTSIVLMATCSSDFALSPPPTGLPARICAMNGGSCLTNQFYTFGVTFKPTTTGTQSCEVITTSNPYPSGSAVDTLTALSGSGMGSSYAMDVTPSMLDFGSISTTSTSGPQSLIVTNTGTSALDVTVTLSGTAGAFFVFQPALVSPLHLAASGGSQTYSIQCKNPGNGSNIATLTFATGSSEGMITKNINLSCTGVSSNITASPINFGTVFVGAPATTQSVSFMNSGTVSATLSSFTLANAPTDVTIASAPTSIVIPPSTTVMNAVTIQYGPTAAAPSLGALQFSDGANTLRDAIAGRAVTGALGVNPSSPIDLGTVCTGMTASKMIEVYASAPGDVIIMTASDPFPFVIGASLPLTVKGDHGLPSLTITASLQTMTPGDVMRSLDLTTNLPTSPTSIALKAHVVTGGTDPTSLHFGNVDVGTTVTQDVVLANCGAATLTITGTHIAGDVDDFISASGAISLMPTEQATFHVDMKPLTKGNKTATLVIENAAGAAMVPLDGTGQNGSGTVDRQTYYACSTGRPITAWPIALGLLALRRRRR